MDRLVFNLLVEEERKKREREQQQKTNEALANLMLLMTLEASMEKQKEEKIDLCKKIMAEVSGGTFFTDNINREKVVTIMKNYSQDPNDEVKVVALETLTMLCYNNQNYRERFIYANTMEMLMKIVEKSSVGGVVLNGLLALSTLLGAGHPGETVATQLKSLLPQIYRKIGTNNEQSWIWKMRTCVVHNIGLLSFRTPLNIECNNLIREFLNQYKNTTGEAFAIKANDVRNLFRTDQLIRMLGYYLIAHNCLSADPGWDQIVEFFYSFLNQDWTDSNFGMFMQRAAEKMQSIKPDLRYQLQKQVDAIRRASEIPKIPETPFIPVRDPKLYANNYPSAEHTREDMKPKFAPMVTSISIGSFSSEQNSHSPPQQSTSNSQRMSSTTSQSSANLQTPPKVSSLSPQSSANLQSSPKVSSPPSRNTNSSTSSQSRRGASYQEGPPSRRQAPVDATTVESVLAEIENTDFQRDFTNIEKIDSGGFGTVSSALWRNNRVAVKIIPNPLHNIAPKVVLGIKRELDIISKMRHDRTLTLLHHCKDKDNIYLVTKFYERKSLYHLLHIENLLLSKDDFCILVKDICDGLTYIHNHAPQILHLDLKSKNILIDGFKEPRAIIADFGLSVMKRESYSQLRIQPCGTYPYMAPEIITGLLTDKTDIYSFSIIMWEMLFNSEPYPKLVIPMENILPLVKEGLRPKWNEVEVNYAIPNEVKQLVERCWQAEPTSRPSAMEIMEEIRRIHKSQDIQF